VARPDEIAALDGASAAISLGPGRRGVNQKAVAVESRRPWPTGDERGGDV